jgi:hypothetical protein
MEFDGGKTGKISEDLLTEEFSGSILKKYLILTRTVNHY